MPGVLLKMFAKFILGKKLGASQIFDEKGNVVPVTLIEAGPCRVLQKKSKEKDGYEAIQVGFVPKIKKIKIKKTEKGKEFRYLKEFSAQGGPDSGWKIGDTIDTSIFQEGDRVKISGVSKGKGFQGAVKKWGHSGRNATHGVKHEHRTLGSVGISGVGRVFKGRKMAGRTGGVRVTVRNLKIVKVNKENNLLFVKGAVPGPKGGLLEIRGI